VADAADRLASLAVAGPVGRAPELGGPQVLSLSDMAGTYLRATGRSRPILPFRLPGKTFGGFRAGYHQAPDHADGLITFAEYLGQSD
jgi:uncharacterized protein YbjT (DUF2867 family)